MGDVWGGGGIKGQRMNQAYWGSRMLEKRVGGQGGEDG